jgi:hypothetical protein
MVEEKCLLGAGLQEHEPQRPSIPQYTGSPQMCCKTFSTHPKNEYRGT